MPSERKNLRAVLADDEPLARRVLAKLIGEDPEIELLAQCANGDEAVAAVREHRPDLLLLDVQMPGKTGFDVLGELEPTERPVVVFVTAFDQYALDAFDVHAVDYVLKPFDDARFAQALERAKQRARVDRVLAAHELDELLTALAPRDPSASPLERITIRREGRVEIIDTNDVVWIEAADQYVMIHTAESQQLMRESMSHLERRLDPERFLRIHRSAIVSLNHLKALDRASGSSRVLLTNGAWIPVSRARLSELKRRLG
ncbi:MAG: response regulator transcription factor [bacterium]|nr:response regulator transcription factor [bacterium]